MPSPHDGEKHQHAERDHSGENEFFGLCMDAEIRRARYSVVAFTAVSWKAVDEFHAAALANGGTCDGPPGLRLHYAPDFYAAYVRDPDGNKVAALCRGFSNRAGITTSSVRLPAMMNTAVR